MNNYTNEEIIKNEYKNALLQFTEIRLFGVFYCSTGEILTIFFPTVQDITINCRPMFALANKDTDFPNYWMDFRLILDKLYNSHGDIIQIFTTENYIISPIYQKSYSKLRKEFGNMKIKDYYDKANDLAEMLTKIFDHYLQFRDGVQDKIFDSLTKTEEKALIFCLEEIGDEGVLSINEAIKKSGISRPVFTGMLDKLDRYKGAEIKNMGVKGTYINFHDHILSKFEIT